MHIRHSSLCMILRLCTLSWFRRHTNTYLSSRYNLLLLDTVTRSLPEFPCTGSSLRNAPCRRWRRGTCSRSRKCQMPFWLHQNRRSCLGLTNRTRQSRNRHSSLSTYTRLRSRIQTHPLYNPACCYTVLLSSTKNQELYQECFFCFRINTHLHKNNNMSCSKCSCSPMRMHLVSLSQLGMWARERMYNNCRCSSQIHTVSSNHLNNCMIHQIINWVT